MTDEELWEPCDGELDATASEALRRKITQSESDAARWRKVCEMDARLRQWAAQQQSNPRSRRFDSSC